MNRLRVCLLGPPVVRWQGHFLSIPRRRVRALLFRLAVEMQPVAREHLATLFWTSVSDAAAHRDLSHLICHLRDALPDPGCVEVERDFVCLNPASVWSDTSAFMDLFHVSQSTRENAEAHDNHSEDCAEIMGAMLYRGPLMDGFFLDEGCEFDEWLTFERCLWERRFQLLFAAIARKYPAMSPMTAALHHARFALEAEQSDPTPRIPLRRSGLTVR